MVTARTLHRRLSYLVAIPALILALTGVVLAFMPLKEGLTTGSISPAEHLSVAALANDIANAVPGAEKITKSANNTITVNYFYNNEFGTAIYLPETGAVLPKPQSSPVWSFLKELHRSLFIGEFGRATSGATALILFLISISGMWILITRMGGWRALFVPPKSYGLRKVHLVSIRFSVWGLVTASATGTFLSLTSFSILPEPMQPNADYPDLAGLARMQISEMPALQAVQLSNFRELTLPYPDDPFDPIGLRTNSVVSYIDPNSGFVVSSEILGPTAKIYEFVYLLHTGEGAWWVGILVGLSLLTLPVAIVSGVAIALNRPRSPINGIKQAAPSHAQDIILVGSEGGTTWLFAAELGRKLSLAGRKINIASMNDVRPSYASAENVFILTSTFGDGCSPQSATQFLEDFQFSTSRDIKVSVVGFGDRKYPGFCAFAKRVALQIERDGLEMLQPLTLIDRQNAQAFNEWGNQVGQCIGCDLNLKVSLEPSSTSTLVLASKETYGISVDAPVSILRFAKPERGLGNYNAGDLVGIIAPDCDIPRYYSLASSRSDGFLEICVRKQPNGRCSSFLSGLEAGQKVTAFVKRNPEFNVKHSQKPLILIGSGAGIGPLMGFLRGLRGRRPVYMYWGGRSKLSDFLYESTLDEMKDRGDLTALSTAFSRDQNPVYVQSKLLADEGNLRTQILQGADIMVCGGQAMAKDVSNILSDILSPLKITLADLKSQKRFVEDVY